MSTGGCHFVDHVTTDNCPMKVCCYMVSANQNRLLTVVGFTKRAPAPHCLIRSNECYKSTKQPTNAQATKYTIYCPDVTD